jgi:protein-S-isoprenylcysteine O-methyltransferase Ste14
MRARVKDKEEKLQRQFGKEWDKWNERTARFMPFFI